MKTITYGFFGEDEAQRIFLQNYLLQLAGTFEGMTFYRDEAFHWRFRASNKKEVDNLFAEAALEGFSVYNLDLYFVGRDSDHHDPKVFEDLEANMLTKIWP